MKTRLWKIPEVCLPPVWWSFYILASYTFLNSAGFWCNFTCGDSWRQPSRFLWAVLFPNRSEEKPQVLPQGHTDQALSWQPGGMILRHTVPNCCRNIHTLLLRFVRLRLMYHEVQVSRLHCISFPLLKNHRFPCNLTNNIVKSTFQRQGFLVSSSLGYSCQPAWPLHTQTENIYSLYYKYRHN